MIWVRRIGIVAAVAAALAVAWYGQAALVGAPEPARGFTLLLAGCAAAALLIEVGRRWMPPSRWPEASAIAEAAAVALLIAVGCWLRIVGFDQIPAGMNHDAAWNGIYANHIHTGESEYTPYVSAAWGRETFFMYMVAAAQIWFGPTAAAVQAAGIAAGVAAFVPMYLLIRGLFGRVAGLAGLAFFAVSGWHWVYCRIGWRCVTVPPFEALALYFLWRALRRGGVLAWLGTGAFAAASIYTYNAARVVPIVIGGLAIWYVLLHRDAVRWPLRRVVRDAFVATFAFLAVGWPMLWYAANNWVQFQGRAEHLIEGDGAEGGVIANFLTALQMFNYRGNGNDFFVAEPLLEPLAGVLFALGAVLLLLRGRSAAAQFTLLGLVLSLVPGLLSSPNGNRCITAMPFAYAIIGVGAAATARLVASLFAVRAAPWAAAAVLVVAFAQATATTYAQYLSEQRRFLVGVSPEATAVGEYIGRFGENYRVYTVSDAWPDYTLQYLGYTHGNPLEPDIVIGRSLADVEKRISRYGRKGLVLIGDLTASGEAARQSVARTFDESRIESVVAGRLGGREVARAVVVEPRAASRTAPWSNLTRVLEVSPAADGTGRGVRCFEPLVSAVGSFSARARVMAPEIGAPRDVAFSLATDCSTAAAAVTFRFASDGLVVDGPRRAVLVASADLQAGRWYDLGLVIDSVGNASAMVDGSATDLGSWDGRPRRIAGFIAATAAPAGAPALYVDDFAVVARALPADSPWWQTPPAPEDEQVLWESFEGLPLGDLAGRPGWRDEGIAWRVRGGPAGPSGSAVVAGNAFDGGTGSDPGQFNEPMGVGVDAAGNIYVCERMNNRVQKFAADGTYLGEWGVLGEQPGEFREPFDLAVDGERVYVMDTWNTRLQVFDLTGNYLHQIGPDPMLGKPRGITVRDGKVYMANSGRDDILVFDLDGKLLAQFPPPESSTLRQIVDLVVDSQGRIYVNNSEQNRIEIFSAAGERLGAIEVKGWNSPHLKEFYMAIDDDDVIYVTDWDLHAVRRFRTDGTELPPVGPPMERPSGLDLHDGKVIVAARGENVLRVFPLPASAP